jgi:predicted CopG family antitoxin
MESTTVKVSKETVKKLVVLQRRLRARSIEETIRLLVKRHRKELLEDAFGADRGKLAPFREVDRGEDRS